jgi:hypothetical protein
MSGHKSFGMDKGTQVGASLAQVTLPRYFDCKILQDSARLVAVKNECKSSQLSGVGTGFHPRSGFLSSLGSFVKNAECIRLATIQQILATVYQA